MLGKWTLEQAESIFNLPFNQIIYEAQTIHRKHFAPNKAQISTLLSIKTGSCPENCSYCPVSKRKAIALKRQALISIKGRVKTEILGVKCPNWRKQGTGVVLLKPLFFANALPDDVFKYASNFSALDLSIKAV